MTYHVYMYYYNYFCLLPVNDSCCDNSGEEAPNSHIDPILTLEELAQVQASVINVEVCQAVRQYLVDLGTATRQHPSVELGLSPRGLITWQRVSQAWAYLQGRNFVVPDDVQAVATPVLQLRISNQRGTTNATISEIIESVAVPNETPSN